MKLLLWGNIYAVGGGGVVKLGAGGLFLAGGIFLRKGGGAVGLLIGVVLYL
ncbi:hypothetical protein [Bartonella sp. AA97HXZ]|uniref:hypothetical protein n=1 Tax=Bartonella sp. AA97HXZ TaxID=1460972 RepID=UPI0035CEE8F9